MDIHSSQTVTYMFKRRSLISLYTTGAIQCSNGRQINHAWLVKIMIQITWLLILNLFLHCYVHLRERPAFLPSPSSHATLRLPFLPSVAATSIHLLLDMNSMNPTFSYTFDPLAQKLAKSNFTGAWRCTVCNSNKTDIYNNSVVYLAKSNLQEWYPNQYLPGSQGDPLWARSLVMVCLLLRIPCLATRLLQCSFHLQLLGQDRY